MDDKQLQHEHAHRGEVIKELSHLTGELQAELLSARLQMKRLQDRVRNLEAQKPQANQE